MFFFFCIHPHRPALCIPRILSNQFDIYPPPTVLPLPQLHSIKQPGAFHPPLHLHYIRLSPLQRRKVNLLSSMCNSEKKKPFHNKSQLYKAEVKDQHLF